MKPPSRVSHLKIEDTGSDVLVHDGQTQKIHILNRTAGQVLMACDGTTEIPSIARRVCPEASEEVERDVIQIVDEFARLGLLRI